MKGTQASPERKLGLSYWMPRVLKEVKKAGKGMDVKHVHDLRTSLRRCLAIEEVFAEFDSHPDWKRMRKAGKKLLKHVGGLRDSQVLLDWLERLEIAKSDLGKALAESIRREQDACKAEAMEATEGFHSHKWKSWMEVLVTREKSLVPESLAFEYVALERWQKAYQRHRFAVRSRSATGYHRLRVGLKEFRYTVENFLPGFDAQWGGELKQLQDLLGEVHDLDVLWAKVTRGNPAADRAARTVWKAELDQQKKQRIAQYLARTTGKHSLWHGWRAALPRGERLEKAAVAKLDAWASFRTPRYAHIQLTAELAVNLYDILTAGGFTVGLPTGRARYLVQAAALLQDVGRAEAGKGHHKYSYRLIRKQPVPIGWKPDELQLVALAARYHRKTMPRRNHKELKSLPLAMQRATVLLAGILRLANGLAQAPKPTHKLDLDVTAEGLVIRAHGWDGDEPLLSRVAIAKHLLEIACGRPIKVVPGAAGATVRRVESKASSYAA